MRMERRDHQRRAETVQRVTQWITAQTSPAQGMPNDLVPRDVGVRILKRMAFRGLIRYVGTGWIAHPMLVTPPQLLAVDAEETRSNSERREGVSAMQCRHCFREGVVRQENVVRGTVAERHFFCGLCGHSWKQTDRRSMRSARTPRDRSNDYPVRSQTGFRAPPRA
jgi:hypothetical protein